MRSKYAILALTFILSFSSISIAFATNGVVLTPSQVGTSGPLVDRVLITAQCPGSGNACNKGLLISGSAQAVEFTFSNAAYTALTTLAPAAGCTAYCVGGLGPSMSWFGLGINHEKFPGSDVHFRRAMQYIQNVSYNQATVLVGGEGVASSDVVVCPPLPLAACPGVSPYNIYTYNLTKVGQELEQIDGSYLEPDGSTAASLFCTNAGVACAGTYSGASTWCLVAADSGGNGICDEGGNSLFAPALYYRTSHHRTPWGLKMIGDLGSIGVGTTGGLTLDPTTDCFAPAGTEVLTPGSFIDSGPQAGYNTVPVTNATAILADNCDMLTYGFISTTPTITGLASTVNSQFAGVGTNIGNFWDDGTYSYPPDTVQTSCPSGTYTGASNVDYESNLVLYAPTLAAGYTAIKAENAAKACAVPDVMGYYEYNPWVVNVDGWTGYAGVDNVGAGELGGIYWTLMNVQQCGSATCTLGAVNGGTLGGNFSYSPQFGADASYAFNPTYPVNWVWQAVVNGEFYDGALAVAPTDFLSINTYIDYMLTSHSDVAFSGVTGAGGTWFYFQQSCVHGAVTLAMCQPKAGPEQAPAPKQHGVGLTAAQRTLTNGQKITITLKNNIFFYDGQQVTAKDIMASMDAQNYATSPNYPDSASPGTSVAAGPNGLIAAHIVPGTHNLGLELFFGKQAVWNLATAGVAVMPAHLLKYINHDLLGTLTCTADLSMPWTPMSGSCAGLTTGTIPIPAASYLKFQSNTNFGSGPFILSCIDVSHDPAAACYDSTNGAGAIDRNPYYFNSNWSAAATVNVAGGPLFTYSTDHIYEIYNNAVGPVTCGPSTPTPIAAGDWGNCQLMAPWASSSLGTVKVYDSSGNLVRSLKLLHNVVTGTYSVDIPIFQAKVIGGAACGVFQFNVCIPLGSGQYEIVIQANFNFHVPGVPSSGASVWYQQSGFTVP